MNHMLSLDSTYLLLVISFLFYCHNKMVVDVSYDYPCIHLYLVGSVDVRS